MRIALLGDALVRQSAGVYYYTWNFYERLISHYPNHEYFLILPSAFGKLNAKEIIVPIKNGIPYHQRIRQFVDIPRAVNKLQADVVIEPAHFGPFRVNKSIKRVTVIHDLTPINFPEYHKGLDVLMHKILLKGILKKADLVITNSETTSRDVKSRYSSTQDKIQILYPSLAAPPTEKQSYDIQGPYLLTVGTVEPRKNHLTIVKAFEQMAKENQEMNLVIAGKSGWKNEALFEYLSQSKVKDRIIWTDYVSRAQLWSLYEQATGFIYMSFYEGFGMPAMEAMQFNLAMILSDIDSLKEVAGEQAVYIKPNDILGLSSAMLEMSESKISTKHEAQLTALDQSTDKQLKSLAIRLGL